MLRVQICTVLRRHSLLTRYFSKVILPAVASVILVVGTGCILYWLIEQPVGLASRRPSLSYQLLSGRTGIPFYQKIRANESRPRPQRLPMCPLRPPGLKGPVTVQYSRLNEPLTSNSTNDSLMEHLMSPRWQRLLVSHGWDMLDGGRYQPRECSARQKLGIVIPYHNRAQHLYVFLEHMLPILKRQQLDFKIYVIEQERIGSNERFNRGLMKNIGFFEALRDFPFFTCVIFHDVDLMLENDYNLYVCDDTQPRHLSVAVSDYSYILPYDTLVGGVAAFPVKTFREVNGFSNLYWGWGVEDDDLAKRIQLRGFRITRPDANKARYKALPHKKHGKKDVEPDRSRIRQFIKQNMPIDGLSSLVYKKVAVGKFELFTWINVAVRKDDYRGQRFKGYPWNAPTTRPVSTVQTFFD